MLGPACSHNPLGVFCLVLLVVGEEFCECDWLVVVYLDRCVQNAVVRLEIRPVVSRHQKLRRLYSNARANDTLLLFSAIDMLQKTIFSVSMSVKHDDRRVKRVWPCLIRKG